MIDTHVASANSIEQTFRMAQTLKQDGSLTHSNQNQLGVPARFGRIASPDSAEGTILRASKTSSMNSAGYKGARPKILKKALSPALPTGAVIGGAAISLAGTKVHKQVIAQPHLTKALLKQHKNKEKR